MMTISFREYRKKEKALALEDMKLIHEDLLSEIQGDEDAQELYLSMVEKAIKYLNIRSRWILLSKEQKWEQDASRTSCHDSLIVRFDMLSRYLKSVGKTAEWRDRLGYEADDRMNRKVIGDFACYIGFVYSLNAR